MQPDDQVPKIQGFSLYSVAFGPKGPSIRIGTLRIPSARRRQERQVFSVLTVGMPQRATAQHDEEGRATQGRDADAIGGFLLNAKVVRQSLEGKSQDKTTETTGQQDQEKRDSSNTHHNIDPLHLPQISPVSIPP